MITSTWHPVGRCSAAAAAAFAEGFPGLSARGWLRRGQPVEAHRFATAYGRP